MQESYADLFNYIRICWSKKWLVIFVAYLICLVGWPVVVFMPDVYEAKAKVYFDTSTMLTPLLRGLAVEANVGQEFASMARQTLLSRPNLKRVIDGTELSKKAVTAEKEAKLLVHLSKSIAFLESKQKNIYEIAYKNEQPQLANDVVEMILKIFMEGAINATQMDTDFTTKFLDRQIEDYQKRLELAEIRLKEFKRKNVGLMPTEAGGYYKQLENANAVLTTAQLELSEALKRREELQRQLDDERKRIERWGGGLGPDSIDQRVVEMEGQLSNLLLRYTDSHPDVIALERSIADLKRRKALRLNATNVVDEPTFIESQIYTELKIQLGKIEAEVAAVQVRAEEYRKRVDRLAELVDTIPKVEAGLSKLNRDYNIDKSNYETLVARRESAKISQDANESTNEVQFKVVEPPLVPIVPIWPNRPLLTIIVLATGVAAGLALAIVLAQIRPVFYQIKDLQKFTGLNVLGRVSLVNANENIKLKYLETFGFIFMVLMLFACVGMIILASIMYPGVGMSAIF